MQSLVWGKAAFAAGIILPALIAVPARAASYYFDFDDFYIDGVAQGVNVANSEYGVSDQWAALGITLSATNKAGTHSAPLLLFDSNPDSFTGDDADLRSGAPWGTEVQDKVLIIQQDGFDSSGRVRNWTNPNDEAGGGIISFKFDQLVDIGTISLLDIDDFGVRGKYISFAAYDSNGDPIGAITQFDEASLDHGRATRRSSAIGDNSLYDFALSYRHVARLDVLYPGSGAITGLQWTTSGTSSTQHIPEPFSAVGLLGVSLIGWKCRRLGNSEG